MKLSDLDLLAPIREQVKIAQKTIKDTPFEKVSDALTSILAGATGLVEVNTLLRSDLALQVAFGRSRCAEQSVVQETLSACTATTVTQPPYSPDVNPVEHVWDELREKYVHNRTFSSLHPLIDLLCKGLNALADDTKRLRSLTNFPHLHVTL